MITHTNYTPTRFSECTATLTFKLEYNRKISTMTLTTHALVGATVAQLFPENPFVGFCLGFASHLAIDSLPHWDYRILSLREDAHDQLEKDMVMGKAFLFDAVRIGTDLLIGITLSIFLFGHILKSSTDLVALCGALGGIAPDPLQFVFWKTRSKFLLHLQRFHTWIQEGKSLHVHPLIGIGLQATVASVIFAFVFWIK